MIDELGWWDAELCAPSLRTCETHLCLVSPHMCFRTGGQHLLRCVRCGVVLRSQRTTFRVVVMAVHELCPRLRLPALRARSCRPLLCALWGCLDVPRVVWPLMRIWGVTSALSRDPSVWAETAFTLAWRSAQAPRPGSVRVSPVAREEHDCRHWVLFGVQLPSRLRLLCANQPRHLLLVALATCVTSVRRVTSVWATCHIWVIRPEARR